MTTDKPEKSPLNPYEPPQPVDDELGHSEMDRRKPGMALWIASTFVWLQCAAVMFWGASIVFLFFIERHRPLGQVEQSVLMLSAAIFVIYAGIAVAQFLAVIRYSAKAAGRAAVSFFGMGIVWVVLVMNFDLRFIGWLIPIFHTLASVVTYRWYQQLRAWDKQDGVRFATVKGYERPKS